MSSEDTGTPQPEAADRRIKDLEGAVVDQEARLGGMLRIAANLTSSRDPRKAMRAIVDDISSLLSAERTTIYELRREEKMLRGLAVQGSGSLEVGIPLGQGIAGQVALRNRSINLKDAYRDPHFDPKFDKLTGFRTRSMLCVPMCNPKREVIGVVQVLNKGIGDYFTLDDERLLSALATQAAITLEALHLQLRLNIGNAELRDLSNQLRQKIHELELLYDNERAMAEAESIQDLANRVLPVAARVAGCEAAALFLPDESGFGPAWVSGEGDSSPVTHFPRIEVGDGVLGKTASWGQVTILDHDDFERHGVSPTVAQGVDLHVADAVAVPLTEGKKTIGSLALLNRRAPGHRDDLADQQLAVLLGGQLSRAVSRVGQRLQVQQRDRLMTIGQMLSGVLHDLKGPMTIISGYSQLMAQTGNEEERDLMAASIRRQVELFNDMTLEVMAFARGERKVLARKVIMAKFVKTVREAIEQEYDERGVKLEVSDESNGYGWFDETKMLRVVANIARNARQALGTEGTFRWLIETTKDEGTLFRLEDDGPGIPEAIRGKLFEAFTTSGKEEGTGLGLAIVRRIVEDHGGSISFTTRTGVGTCFTIRLPCQPEDSPVQVAE